jgi:hypothetical protein
MPLDEMRGKVGIGVETQTTLASVTFWNQGDVEIITMDKAQRKECILDDRKLTAADEIESRWTVSSRFVLLPVEP